VFLLLLFRVPAGGAVRPTAGRDPAAAAAPTTSAPTQAAATAAPPAAAPPTTTRPAQFEAASMFGPTTLSAEADAGCQFQSAPGATAAFCEALAGAAQSGGRDGDLGNGKWSVARFVGVSDNSSPFHFPSTPAS